jgi:hypothetical protein
LYLVLTIPLHQYDTFVKKIDPSSQACQILIRGVIERQTKRDHFERMNIMCKDSEAAMLLDLANQIHPDIAPDIAGHILRANQP